MSTTTHNIQIFMWQDLGESFLSFFVEVDWGARRFHQELVSLVEVKSALLFLGVGDTSSRHFTLKFQHFRKPGAGLTRLKYKIPWNHVEMWGTSRWISLDFSAQCWNQKERSRTYPQTRKYPVKWSNAPHFLTHISPNSCNCGFTRHSFRVNVSPHCFIQNSSLRGNTRPPASRAFISCG